MANFFSFIKVGFKNAFSKEAKKVSDDLAEMKKKATDFANAGKVFSDVAGSLSLMKGTIDQTKQALKNFTDAPNKLFMPLEDALMGVNASLEESASVDMSGKQQTIAKSYDMIKNSALSFSKNHKISAADFVSGTTTMIGAGLNAKDSILGMETAFKLATATQSDSGQMAFTLTQLYMNMGDKSGDTAKEMERLGNIMTATGKTFRIKDFNTFSAGLESAVPTAQRFGISMEQTSAFIGQLNSKQMDGASAGNALNSIMTKLSKGGKELGKLNFNIAYDEKGGVDLISTLGSIKANYENIDFENSSEFLEAFGGAGSKAISLLVNSFGEFESGYAKMVVASTDGNKTMEEQNKKLTSSTSNAFAELQNKKDALKIKQGELLNSSTRMGIAFETAIVNMQDKIMGSPIGGALTSITMKAAKVGEGFFTGMSGALSFSSSLLTTMSLASKLPSGLGVITKGFKTFGSVMKLPFGSLMGGLSGMGRGVMVMIPKLGAWIAANWAVAASQLAVAWPVLAVVAAVALLAAGAFLIVKNWGAVKNFFAGVGKFFVGIGKAIGGFFMGIVNTVKGFFTYLWKVVLGNPFVQGALLIFAPFIAIPIIIIKNWGKISGLFKMVFGFVGNFVGGVAKKIINSPFVQGGVSFFKKGWSGVTGFFGKVGSGIVGGFKKTGEFFQNVGSGIVGGFKKTGNFIGEMGQKINSNLTNSFLNGVNNISGFVSKGSSIAMGLFNKVDGMTGGVLSKVGGVFTGVFKKIDGASGGLFSKMGDNVKGFFSGLVENVKSVGFIKGVFISITTAVKDIFTSVITTIKGVFNAIPNFINSIVEKIKAPFLAIPDFIKNIFDAVLNNPLFKTITGVLGKAKDLFVGEAVKTKENHNAFMTEQKEKKEKKSNDALTDNVAAKKNKKSGEALIDTMATGVKKNNALQNAVETNFNKVDELIPHSDAKKGAFARLSEAGGKIISTMGLGVEGEDSLTNTIDRKFGEIDLNANINQQNSGGVKQVISQNNNSTGQPTGTPVYNINIKADYLFRDIDEFQDIKNIAKIFLDLAGIYNG